MCLLQEVTLDNVEEYIECVTDFCLNTGIRRQMEAFRGESTLQYSHIHRGHTTILEFVSFIACQVFSTRVFTFSDSN